MTTCDPSALISLISTHSRRLDPIDAGVENRGGVGRPKAILFDVYGTLLVSAAGEIASADEGEADEPFRSALSAVGLPAVDPYPTRLRQVYRQLIDAEHRRKAADGSIAPEVDIEAIWARALAEALSTASEWSTEPKGSAKPFASSDDIRCVARVAAVAYELAANPTWEMPGARRLVTDLVASGIPIGIVSNAQFYTPLFMEALLGDSPGRLGFCDDLVSWSYEVGHAKPDPRVFAGVTSALHRRGIDPAEAVFVGNDMRNDVATAAREGLRTCLFAGDRRSLRLRSGDPAVAGIRPTAVVRSLDTLRESVLA